MRVKIINACINGRWMLKWRNKAVDLYCPDEEENSWNVENVEGEKGTYSFSGDVFINWESIPQESKLAQYSGQEEEGLR